MLTWAIAFASWALQDRGPMIFVIFSIPADALIVLSAIEAIKTRKS